MNKSTEETQQFISLITNNSSLNSIQDFYEINKDNINISAYNDYAFQAACQNGHLEIAKWLLKNKSDINISAGHDLAFSMACNNGHLKIAKWLFEIKPDIDILIDNEWAFYIVCRGGYLKLAKWFVSLNPNRYIITIENNKIIEYYVKNHS